MLTLWYNFRNDIMTPHMHTAVSRCTGEVRNCTSWWAKYRQPTRGCWWPKERAKLMWCYFENCFLWKRCVNLLGWNPGLQFCTSYLKRMVLCRPGHPAQQRSSSEPAQTPVVPPCRHHSSPSLRYTSMAYSGDPRKSSWCFQVWTGCCASWRT